MSNVQEVNDVNFDQEVLQSDLPVLVDFTAVWCGPCKMIAPLVDEVASEFEGKVKVVKLDIDQSPGTAEKFGIRGVPTLKVFKAGSVIAEQVGAVPKPRIVELMNASL